MRTHRVARLVAILLFLAGAVYFCGGLVVGLSLWSRGLGEGWGSGFAGWLSIPILFSTFFGAATLLIFGAILYFLARIDTNLLEARDRIKAMKARPATGVTVAPSVMAPRVPPEQAPGPVEPIVVAAVREVPKIEPVAAVAAGAIAIGAAAVAGQEATETKIEVAAPQFELPQVAAELPNVELAAAEVALPKVAVEPPMVEVATPQFELPQVPAELPKVELAAAEVALPKVAVEPPTVEVATPQFELPQVAAELPKVELAAPQVELPKFEVAAPKIDLAQVAVEPPKVEVAGPAVSAPKLSGLEALVVGIGRLAFGGAPHEQPKTKAAQPSEAAQPPTAAAPAKIAADDLEAELPAIDADAEPKEAFGGKLPGLEEAARISSEIAATGGSGQPND